MLQEILIFLFTDVASTETYLAALLLIIGLLLRYRKFTLAVAVTTLASLQIGSVIFLKQFFAVPRPDDALVDLTTYAFPSGHATGVMFLAACIWCCAYLYHRHQLRPIAVLLIILVLLVGLSRVYLGVHTPLQVLAGYGLGAFWGMLLIATSQLQPKKQTDQHH